MRFTVPQFIEMEAKIVGFLTFKQFIVLFMAALICGAFRFVLPFSFFIIATIIVVGGALALAFLKIGGRSLPVVLGNFLKFKFSPKMFIWKKVETPIQVFKKEEVKEEETIEETPLKIAEKSQLKKLHTFIETKTK